MDGSIVLCSNNADCSRVEQLNQGVPDLWPKLPSNCLEVKLERFALAAYKFYSFTELW
jgi:hypothetical protein